MSRYRLKESIGAHWGSVLLAIGLFGAGQAIRAGYLVAPFYLFPILLTIRAGSARWTGFVAALCLIFEAFSGLFGEDRAPGIAQFAMFCAVAAAGLFCARQAAAIASINKARQRADALMNLIEQAHRSRDEAAVFRVAVKALGKTLSIDRARIIALRPDLTDAAPPILEWRARGVTSVGQLKIELQDIDWSGRTLCVHDTAPFLGIIGRLRDNHYVKSGLFARISCGGQTAFLLTVHNCRTAHKWTRAEIAYVTDMAEHIELFIESLTAERETRRSLAEAFNREQRINYLLQRSLVPSLPKSISGVNASFIYHPAQDDRSIGGDFIDMFPLQGNRLAVLIGDVAGQGVEAAAHTALLTSLLRAFAFETLSPAAVINKLNHAIGKQLQPEMFVTLFFGILSLSDGRMEYASAGHEPPVVYRRDGKLDVLEPTGAVVGFDEDQLCESTTITLDPADILFMFTDGLTEAQCPATNIRLGAEAFYDCIRCTVPRFSEIPEIASGLWNEVALRLGTQILQDDAALFIISRRCEGT